MPFPVSMECIQSTIRLITAAFFMEGLHDARPGNNVKPNYDVLIETWGQGCIELVDTLVSYVPFATMLCEAAAIACDGNYPGVFDYEVSSSFGKWFGEHILECGDEPSQENAETWLTLHIGEFFAQGMTKEQADEVKTAINAAVALLRQRMPAPNIDSKKSWPHIFKLWAGKSFAKSLCRSITRVSKPNFLKGT